MELITFLEIIGTITGILHLWLLTRQNIIAWPIGIICVSIFLYIFYDAKLYSDSILQICYIGLNLFGWYNWSRRKEELDFVKVTRLAKKHWALVIGIILSGTFLWGWFMTSKTDADFPYIDAFTTVASLTAQYLLTQKKIGNWVIWIVVNLVSIPLYLYKGLTITAGLFCVYLTMCILGYIEWKKELNTEKTL